MRKVELKNLVQEKHIFQNSLVPLKDKQGRKHQVTEVMSA